jgi:hypothetical protein
MVCVITSSDGLTALTVMQEHPTVQHDHWKVLGRGNAFKELGG